MHTGYREGQGGLIYPSLGAIVSSELGKTEFPLPNFVSIGDRSYGSGFLGARHQPLVVNDPTPRRRKPQAARRGKASSTSALVCWKRWSGVLPRLPGRVGPGPQDDLSAGRHVDEVEGGEGLRPVAGAGFGSRRPTATAKFGRGLPAGPPAGRGRACRSSK